MMQALLLASVLGSAYLGFALLALSQDRHWHHLGGARHCPPRAVRVLRILGYALVFAALPLCLLRDGAGFGSLLWLTGISVCAFAVVCTLTWRTSWLRPLALACQRFVR